MSSISAANEPAGDSASMPTKAGASEREIKYAGVAAMVVFLSLVTGYVIAQAFGLTRTHCPELASVAGFIGMGLCTLALIAVPLLLAKSSLQQILYFAGFIFMAGGMLLALTL